LAKTCSVTVSGKWHRKRACRDLRSRRLTWSQRMAPPWSSARAHSGAYSESAASDPNIDWWSWDELGLGTDWAALLEQREAEGAEPRAATYTRAWRRMRSVIA